MVQRNLLGIAVIVTVFILGFWFGKTSEGKAAAKNRVFELRTYTASEGKFEALHARFRNHTMKLFKKHGMTNVGYWTPKEEPLSQNTLVYILAFPSREAAQKSWERFNNDAEWKKIKQESEMNGKLVGKVDSIYLDPTDYSPMK